MIISNMSVSRQAYICKYMIIHGNNGLQIVNFIRKS